MRGFKEKIEWQRKILGSINWAYPKEQQLPGLTEQSILTWEAANSKNTSAELILLIFRASDLTNSLNDFSAPIIEPIDDIYNKLEQLCIALHKEILNIKHNQPSK